MLPKIAVSVIPDRTVLLKRWGLSENYIMAFEGSEAKVPDLRQWIYNSVNIAAVKPELSLMIWDADELSPECQAILLKPMEELAEKTDLWLIVKNENRLMTTILSRGVISYFESEVPEEIEKYWSDIRKCWSSGPAACIALSDRIDKAEFPAMIEEVIKKLKAGLASEVNEKRLLILDMAITCLNELKQTNVNPKLSLDNFLLGSWRMIKA